MNNKLKEKNKCLIKQKLKENRMKVKCEICGLDNVLLIKNLCINCYVKKHGKKEIIN